MAVNKAVNTLYNTTVAAQLPQNIKYFIDLEFLIWVSDRLLKFVPFPLITYLICLLSL